MPQGDGTLDSWSSFLLKHPYAAEDVMGLCESMRRGGPCHRYMPKNKRTRTATALRMLRMLESSANRQQELDGLVAELSKPGTQYMPAAFLDIVAGHLARLAAVLQSISSAQASASPSTAQAVDEDVQELVNSFKSLTVAEPSALSQFLDEDLHLDLKLCDSLYSAGAVKVILDLDKAHLEIAVPDDCAEAIKTIIQESGLEACTSVREPRNDEIVTAAWEEARHCCHAGCDITSTPFGPRGASPGTIGVIARATTKTGDSLDLALTCAHVINGSK